MNKRIYLSAPSFSHEEIELSRKAIESGWLSSMGPNIDSFKKKLENHFQSNVLLTNSGTSAIHLALLASKIEEGDYVLCSNFTFAASAFPILYQKANPIFIGIEKDSWNIDTRYLEEAIHSSPRKPKALILTHVYGMSAKLDEIIEICHKNEIILIEDAAEALGATYNGTPLGTFGKFGIISFNGNKIITTSAGGCLLSKDATSIAFATTLASQAKMQTPHYEHEKVGYNYLMSNILAAIGEAQIMTLEEKLQKRIDTFENYKMQWLQNNIDCSYQKEHENSKSNRWLSSFVFENASIPGLIDVLNDENIESRNLFKPLNEQAVFDKYLYFGDHLESRLFKNGISLPSGFQLTNEDLDKIINIILNYLKS